MNVFNQAQSHQTILYSSSPTIESGINRVHVTIHLIIILWIVTPSCRAFDGPMHPQQTNLVIPDNVGKVIEDFLHCLIVIGPSQAWATRYAGHSGRT